VALAEHGYRLLSGSTGDHNTKVQLADDMGPSDLAQNYARESSGVLDSAVCH